MKKYLGLGIFLIFLIILIFVTYKHYGVPWDEKIFFNVGKYFASSFLNFLHFNNNLNLQGFIPTDYHIKGHGVFYDIFIVFVTLILKNFSVEKLHLIRALSSIPIFICVYFIVSYFLKPRYGLIALIFLLLFPRFYSDIFTNAIDVPTALFFTLSVAYFFYFVKSNQNIWKQVLFGIILGLTINQRLVFFYLIPLNFTLLFFINRTKTESLVKFLVKALTILFFTILTIHLTHPYLLAHPITGLYELVSYSNKYPWNASVFFDGRFYQAGINPLPWYYLPKSMLLTIPIVTLALFLMGHMSLIRLMGKTKDYTNKLFYFYLLSIFYLPLILNYILKPTLYDSWRHFLFLTIPIVIIATFGLQTIFNLIKNQFPTPINTKHQSPNKKSKLVIVHWLLVLVIGLLIVIGYFNTAFEMIRLHPYEYIYYNSLVGGLKGAYGKYETDYWGLGYKDAVLWFNKNVNKPDKQYTIYVEGDPLSSSYYFKPNMQLTTDVNEADYIFTFTRWNFHILHPGKNIYIFKKEDVPLIFIKQLHG